MSVMDSFSMAGRVALVTGGGGLFGRQIVESLALAGATVVVTSRHVESLKSQCEAWKRKALAVHAMTLDQSDEQSIMGLKSRLQDDYGRLDVLVNNAVHRSGDDWLSPPAGFDQSMKANATGLFLLTRELGEWMTSRGSGSIINIASIQGMVGPDFSLYEGLDWPSSPEYFFHKAGMINFTRYVAARLGARGVRCNAISPGGFFNHQDPRFVDRYNVRTFLGRMANETDLQGAIVFLASDASRYVTGVNLPVDGGYTAK